jgi:hypothetical protein
MSTTNTEDAMRWGDPKAHWSDLPIELRRCPVHGIPDCSPILNGCSIPNQMASLYAQGRERGYDEGVSNGKGMLASAIRARIEELPAEEAGLLEPADVLALVDREAAP